MKHTIPQWIQAVVAILTLIFSVRACSEARSAKDQTFAITSRLTAIESSITTIQNLQLVNLRTTLGGGQGGGGGGLGGAGGGGGGGALGAGGAGGSIYPPATPSPEPSPK